MKHRTCCKNHSNDQVIVVGGGGGETGAPAPAPVFLQQQQQWQPQVPISNQTSYQPSVGVTGTSVQVGENVPYNTPNGFYNPNAYSNYQPQ